MNFQKKKNRKLLCQEYTNPLYFTRMLGSNLNSRYSLKDIIPANLAIKNQQQTNSCWTFASLSSLETNLALSNYRSGIDTSKVYDFSERHMEYATSKTFANNVENPIGYNRNVGSGGNWWTAEPYFINGTGAIAESEMPFENNENTINISEIQNKTVSSQVYDTMYFENYEYADDEIKSEIMNKIKQHIKNYGSVFACIHGNSSNSSLFTCYNDDTGAKYCSNSISHAPDHAVSIIGWDDNYSINNFPENAKPTSNGAWIIRNSWGDLVGDNGLMYVSYEDDNVSDNLYGIIKASDSVDYDNIYQYNEYYPSNAISYSKSEIMLGNIFEKSTSTEYLTQVSLHAAEKYTCRVYVNPNGSSFAKADMELVSLKAGESETVDSGYHTLEFLKPIALTGNKFAVVIEITSSDNRTNILLESRVEYLNAFDVVSVQSGKCFLAAGHNLDNCSWQDLGRLSQANSSLLDGDSTIKAFTTNELIDESLKNIEITTPPTKTEYKEGQNFDNAGMVIEATRKNGIKEIVTDYTIENGNNLKVEQTKVTFSYEDKTVEQEITVIPNPLVAIRVDKVPNKINYIAGQNFDKTGMIIIGVYQDETTVEILDYTIENANNLTKEQTSITISYLGKTTIQDITVIEKAITGISINKKPNKLTYIQNKEDLDLHGGIITVVYNDETTENIDMNSEQVTVTGFDNKNVGQITIKLKYQSKIVDLEVEIIEQMPKLLLNK